MNRHQTDVAIELLLESTARAVAGNPMSEEELLARFDEATDPVRVCIDAAIDGALQGMARRPEEDRD